MNQKGFALLLWALVLCAAWTAFADAPVSAQPLTLNTETEVEVANGETAYFSFTPTVTGTYTFSSLGDGDTFGALYDDYGNKLASDDDSGSNRNFQITQYLTAGVQYDFSARFMTSQAGSMRVLLTREIDWSLENGVLTISGSGPMQNYAWDHRPPWYANRSAITQVVIEDGVTTIGESAFYDCSSLVSVTIPNSVTSIWDWAFDNCSALTDITIPDSVRSIGTSAFSFCSGLTSVTLPSGLRNIGDSAFSFCRGLTNVTIPASVTSIGNNIFYDCSSLTSVTIPESVTSIGNSAFLGCSGLTSVTIPVSVTSIGDSVFTDCSSLKEISVSTGNPRYSSEDGVLFDKQKTKVLCYPAGKTDADYTVPNGVTGIGDGAISSSSPTIPRTGSTSTCWPTSTMS